MSPAWTDKPPVVPEAVTVLLRAQATLAQRKSRTLADTAPLNTGDRRTCCKYKSRFFEIGRVMHSHLSKHMKDISSAQTFSKSSAQEFARRR